MLPTLNKGIFRQYIVTIIVTFGLFIGGTAIAWPNPVIPQLLSNDPPFPITREEISWAVAILHVAYLVNCYPSGYLMDKFGRKPSLLLLSIFPLASYVLILFSKSATMLFVGRFLGGMWLGSTYTIVPMYIAEISEPQIRGALGNFTALMTTFGTLSVYVIGALVQYYSLTLFCVIVTVIFMFTCFWIPESPYYYLICNNCDAAKKTLMWLRDKDEEQIKSELTRISKAVELEMVNKGNVKEIISTRGNRKALLITVVLSLNQKYSGTTGIIAYASITLPSDALVGIGTNGCIIILGVVWFVTGLILLFFIDRIGRKLLLFVSCFGCGTMMLILSVWYYLYENTDIDVTQYNYIPFVCLVFHAISYSLALGPIVNSIKGELFPSNVKAVASVITTIVLALGSFTVNKLYLFIADAFGFYVVFLIFCVASLFGAVFSLVVVVETNGKTLQEIQDKLNGRKI